MPPLVDSLGTARVWVVSAGCWLLCSSRSMTDQNGARQSDQHSSHSIDRDNPLFSEACQGPHVFGGHTRLWHRASWHAQTATSELSTSCSHSPSLTRDRPAGVHLPQSQRRAGGADQRLEPIVIAPRSQARPEMDASDPA